MNIETFVDLIFSTYYAWGSANAYPKEPLRYIEVTDAVQGMTTPSVMHLLNCAVSGLDKGECYVEAGTWRGATFIGAMIGNAPTHGFAIDNDVMDGHDKDARLSSDVWQENVEKFGLAERSTYLDGDIGEVLRTRKFPPVGVYLFDGDKATPQAAFEGLTAITPHLTKQALIIVDDANTIQIRHAIGEFVRLAHPYAHILLDIPTPANCWPGFWNGVLVIAWDSEKT